MLNILVNIIPVKRNTGGISPPVGVLITADSTQYTIDTTTLYTIDNNNTTI